MPTPLELGRFDGALEQRLALAIAAAQALRHRGGERHLDQLEDDERADQSRREREPDVRPARGDGAEALVALEEQRLAVRRRDRQVDLEQLAEALLESVLRRREVADIRGDGAAADRGDLVGAECVPRADQAMVVRVDDRPVGSPDLQPHDRAPEHAPADDAVELRDRRRLFLENAPRQARLDDAGSDDARNLLRVVDRLRRTDVPHHEECRDAHERQRDEPREGELRHGSGRGGRLASGARALPCVIANRQVVPMTLNPYRTWKSLPPHGTPSRM